MGKGEITANLGGGQYSVTLLCNRVEVEKNLNRLNALIEETEVQLAGLPAGDPDFKGPGAQATPCIDHQAERNPGAYP